VQVQVLLLQPKLPPKVLQVPLQVPKLPKLPKLAQAEHYTNVATSM
jgi:hypothetical protein